VQRVERNRTVVHAVKPSQHVIARALRNVCDGYEEIAVGIEIPAQEFR